MMQSPENLNLTRQIFLQLLVQSRQVDGLNRYKGLDSGSGSLRCLAHDILKDPGDRVSRDDLHNAPYGQPCRRLQSYLFQFLPFERNLQQETELGCSLAAV